jgi:hypothetical protein
MESLSHLQTLANVPMLELDGGNWPIFKRKLRDHLEGQGIETHFESSNSPAATYKEIEEKPTKREKEPEEDFAKRMKVWKEGESSWKEEKKSWRKDDTKARSALG